MPVYVKRLNGFILGIYLAASLLSHNGYLKVDRAAFHALHSSSYLVSQCLSYPHRNKLGHDIGPLDIHHLVYTAAQTNKIVGQSNI